MNKYILSWLICLPYLPFYIPLYCLDVFPDRCKGSETFAIHFLQCLSRSEHKTAPFMLNATKSNEL